MDMKIKPMRVNADVPRPLYEKFKIKLIKEHRNITEFMNSVIKEYILKK